MKVILSIAKSWGFIVVFMLFFQLAGANTVDSLKKTLSKNLPDTLRYQTYYTLCWEIRKNNLNEAIPYCEQAVILSKISQDNYLQGDAYYVFSRVYAELELYQLAIQKLQDAIVAYTKAQSDYGVGYCYSDLGYIYDSKLGDFTKGKYYHDLALQISDNTNDDNLTAHVLKNYARYKGARGDYSDCITLLDSSIYLRQLKGDSLESSLLYNTKAYYERILGNYEEARKFYAQAIPIHKKYNNNIYLAQAYYGLAMIERIKGKSAAALSNYLLALEIGQRIGDKKRVAYCYDSMGDLYMEEEDYDNAKKNYFKALNIFKNINNRQLQSSTYSTIGNFYAKINNVDSALYYLDISLTLTREIDFKNQEARALQYIGRVYHNNDEPKKAIPYLQDALKINESINRKGRIASTLYDLAKVYRATSNYIQSNNYARRSLNISRNIDNLVFARRAARIMSQNYESLGNYKSAYFSHQTFKNLNDSVVNQRNSIEFENIKAQYDVENQKKKNDLLMAESQLKDTELSRQRIITITILGVLTLLIGLALFLFRSNVEKRKTNDELLSLNKRVTTQYNQLQVLNTAIAEQNLELQRFASVASHDLKEPLRTIGTFAGLIEEEVETDDDTKSYFNQIYNAINRMGNLLEDLIGYARTGAGTSEKIDINLNEILNATLVNLTSSIQENQAAISYSSTLPTIKAHETPMIQLFQNIISNSIKFQQKGAAPIINISSSSNGIIHQISIKDNGIGIPENKLKDIFEPFKRLHSTDDYNGSGIGLATCKKIVEQYGGKIWVESEVGKGTTFHFTLPK